MNDPFERLRDFKDESVPDVDAIRRRARRVLSRQRTVLLSSAGLIVVALAIVVARPWTASVNPAALSEGSSATPAAETPSGRSGQGLLSADGGNQQAGTSPDPGSSSSPLVFGPGRGTGESKADAAPVPTSPADVTVRLILSKRTFGPGERVQMTLEACNKSQHRVETTFNSGKREDFEVYRVGADDPLWTWSSEKSYTQVVGKKLWEPAECQSWEGAWSDSERPGAYKPGRYEIVGVLASEPAHKTPREPVCLGSCP